MAKQINQMSELTKKAIIRKSAQGLPDRPSASGMKAEDIKKAFYLAITDEKDSVFAELARIIDETNSAFEDNNLHIKDNENPHKVTKEQIGLEKVDNTSDMDKPISTAQQKAFENMVKKEQLKDYVEFSTLENKKYATEAFVLKNIGAGTIGSISVNGKTQSIVNKNVDITIPVEAKDINALPDSTKYASGMIVSMNSSTYEISFYVYDQFGQVIGDVHKIDLPLESVVVGAFYYDETREIVLNLKNGQTLRVPVDKLISGLASQSDLNELTEKVNQLENNKAGKDEIPEKVTDLKDGVDYVKFSNFATPEGEAGVVKITDNTLKVDYQGNLSVNTANLSDLESKNTEKPIPASLLDKAIIYGLTNNTEEISDYLKEVILSYLGAEGRYVKGVSVNQSTLYEEEVEIDNGYIKLHNIVTQKLLDEKTIDINTKVDQKALDLEESIRTLRGGSGDGFEDLNLYEISERVSTNQQNIESLRDGSINNLYASIRDLDNNKVEKESGKELSTNDFTNEYKNTIISNSESIETIENNVKNIDSDIANLKQDKANTATTYTKDEVNNLISSISSLSFKIVNELPETGDTKIIYLLPKTAETNDIYEEYVFINNAWEKIGDTQVDLSDYYKRNEADAIFENKLPKTNIAGKVLLSTSEEGKTEWGNPEIDVTNTDVQIDNNSVTQSGVAKIVTIDGDYNEETNPIATKNNIPKEAKQVNALKSGYVAICDTDGSNGAKSVTIDNFTLYSGVYVSIYFVNDNTVSQISLNINNTGARNVYINNKTSGGKDLKAGWNLFYFNGSNWYTGNYLPINVSSAERADRAVTAWSIGGSQSNLYWTAGENIYEGMICARSTDGSHYSLKGGLVIDLTGTFFISMGSGTAGSNYSYCYLYHYTTNKNGLGQKTTEIVFENKKPIYLVGTLDGTKFTLLNENWYTQEEPTSDDGYTYLYLGHAYWTDMTVLTIEHPLFKFNDGKFRVLADVQSFKLYDSTGQGTDGTINQKTITEELEKKVNLKQGVDNKNKNIVVGEDGNIKTSDSIYIGDVQLVNGLDEDNNPYIEFIFPEES